MKRISSLYPSLLAGCWLLCAPLLSACSDTDEFVYIDETEETAGESITITDADGNESTLSAGSTIGVYVIGEDGSVTLRQVVVGEDGKATLPSTSQGGSVIAYTPYQESWGEDAFTTTPVFTVESDQSTTDNYKASDLMIGAAGEATRADQPGMVLRHMMAKVTIHVVDETGRVDLAHIGAELLGVNNSVYVDLAHQSVTTIDEQRTNIPMLAESTTDWRVSSHAIVAPQSLAEGTTLYAITLYGNRETFTIPEAATLEGGKTYTIYLRLTAYGLIPDGWTISDWEDEAEQSIDIKA